MRAAALIVLLAACGGASSPKSVANAPADQASITLTMSPPKVGDTYTEEESQKLVLTLQMAGGTSSMEQLRVEKKSVEVLEVAGDVVTRARITYETAHQWQSMGGRRVDETSPIAGKTFIVTAGDPIVVETDAGPASEEEAAAVRDAEKRFGSPDRMATVIARTYVEGETVELPTEELTRAMGGDGLRVASMTLTFRGMAGEDARFDMAMAMSGTDSGNEIAVELAGTVVVDPATAEAIEMEITGPFRMSGQVNAEGTMTMSAKRTD